MPNITTQLIVSKVCSKCNKLKSASEFYLHKTGHKQGTLYARCAECCKDERRQHHQNNKEAENKIYRERWATDALFREKGRNKGRAWHEQNRERFSEYQRQRRIESSEKIRSLEKAARQRKPEAHQAHVAVGRAIKAGILPPVDSLKCSQCQEVRAAHYHHPNGYGKPFRLDVIALCTQCHGKTRRKD